MRKHLGILAGVALMFPAIVLADEKEDIVDTAVGAEKFKALVAAVSTLVRSPGISGRTSIGESSNLLIHRGY
jgi:hypothetical protein